MIHAVHKQDLHHHRHQREAPYVIQEAQTRDAHRNLNQLAHLHRQQLGGQYATLEAMILVVNKIQDQQPHQSLNSDVILAPRILVAHNQLSPPNLQLHNSNVIQELLILVVHQFALQVRLMCAVGQRQRHDQHSLRQHNSDAIQVKSITENI